MSVVTLVSGGLDSTVMALLIKRQKLKQYPLFIDYGQLSRKREFAACKKNLAKHELPGPAVVNVSGWGRFIGSGLTNRALRIFEDAFLPGRNLMFLLIGASYAYRRSAGAVAIGLLDEAHAIFQDQTRAFCDKAEQVLSLMLDRPMTVLTPMMAFNKANVVAVAKKLGVKQTYSCHAGGSKPCGVCVACREFKF